MLFQLSVNVVILRRFLPKNLGFNRKTEILRYAQDDKWRVGRRFFNGITLWDFNFAWLS